MKKLNVKLLVEKGDKNGSAIVYENDNINPQSVLAALQLFEGNNTTFTISMYESEFDPNVGNHC